MPSYKPHWSPDADYSSCPFFIRRMDTVGYFKPAEDEQTFSLNFGDYPTSFKRHIENVKAL